MSTGSRLAVGVMLAAAGRRRGRGTSAASILAGVAVASSVLPVLRMPAATGESAADANRPPCPSELQPVTAKANIKIVKMSHRNQERRDCDAPGARRTPPNCMQHPPKAGRLLLSPDP